MGVIAVDVLRRVVPLRDTQPHAGDRHLQTLSSGSTTYRKHRRPFNLKTAPSPSVTLCKPRRLHIRKTSTPRAALKRPSCVSISGPAAAQLIYCSPDLQTSSLPAPAAGAQPICLQPSGIRTPGLDHGTDMDNLPLDYKEAAAVLEQLFTESPSLEDDHLCDGNSSSGDEARLFSSSRLAKSTGRTVSRSAVVSTKRHRKDLMARITLRRKKMGLEQEDSAVAAAEVRKSLGAVREFSSSIWSEGAVGNKLSNSIWSEDATKLLQQHGGVVNLMAQNWLKLGRELLSMEEERWLALLMKPAKVLQKVRDKLRERPGSDAISAKEWAQAANIDVHTLSRHLALHRAARNKLVKLNLRLVRHQAQKYEKNVPASSLTSVELCQEGVKGLIIATDRFDAAKGVRFSSYAIFWIRNAILRAQTRAGYLIRAPFNFAEIKMNIKKVKWEMRLEGEHPIDRQAEGRAMKKMLERVGVDEARYKAVMQSNRRVVSLHKRDPNTGVELIEHLADPKLHHDVTSNYLGHGATDPSLRLGIDDVLDSLKPKESLVLRQRFGLDGKGERALGEIGRNMRMSREMVRRYEARGLLKLKHPMRLDYLRAFLSSQNA